MKKLVSRAQRVQSVLRTARRLSKIGAGPRARVKIFAAAVALGARWILRRPSSRLWELRVAMGGRPFTFVASDYGELQVMRDIVLDCEYDVAGIEPRTILDLGANIGVAAAWFRSRYPNARIVAVEADPGTYAKLERSLGDDDAVTLVNAAVAARSGETTIFRAQGYSVASSLKDTGPETASSARVRACTLDDLCVEHGLERIDLLKLDIEGAELEALEGLSRLEIVGTMVGEVHPPLLDGGPESFFAQLQAFEVDRLSESPESISFVANRSARADATTPRA